MFERAVEVFDVSGFKIRIDPSWLLIAALIIWSLSSAYFPLELPGYSLSVYVTLGTVSMLGLFASLLIHELSHSFMARQFGVKVGNITLFIFGGVAELDDEPKSPKSEFWISIVGPVASLFLAAVFWVSGSLLTALNIPKPATVVFDYLGFINLVIAIFNMIPAFPLDGGRVFRAVLWYLKNDVFSATKIASAFGSAFGFLLIVSGVFSLFSTTSIGGLWQILIGFFVVSASRSSYQQLLTAAALKDQTVMSLMKRPVFSAEADVSIQDVVDNVILKRNVTFVPVTDDGELIGYVTAGLIQAIDRENWETTRLADIYVASSPENTVAKDTEMQTLFSRMTRNNQRKFMITEGTKLVGVISLSDLMTYLAIRNGLAGKPMASVA